MVTAWSPWISRPAVTRVSPPGIIFQSSGSWSFGRNPTTYNGDNEDDYTYPQDDLSAWDCAWHLTRIASPGNVTSPYEPDTWTGSCPVPSDPAWNAVQTYGNDDPVTPGIAYSAHTYGPTGGATGAEALSMSAASPAMALLNVDRLRNDYNEDDLYAAHPDAQVIEYEGEDAYYEDHPYANFFYADTTSAQIEIERDERTSDIARAMLPSKYNVAEPDFTISEGSWFGGGIGLGDHVPSGPFTSRGYYWYNEGSAAPEDIPGWTSLTSSLDVIPVDVSEAQARTDEWSSQARFSGIGFRFGGDVGAEYRGPSHVVMWVANEYLDDSLPSFFNPVHNTNTDLDVNGREPIFAAYAAVVRMRTVLQPARYRYRYEVPDVPPPPADPISTTITGENGSARRSFYNARRRR